MTPFNLKDKKVWVAGHNGMVGAAIMRRLRSEPCETITVSRQTTDLRRQNAVEDWLAAEKPDAIFLAAALVGGIHANNTRPAEFVHGNLAIELNIIEAARRVGVRKVMLLGSSCIYPRLAPQPMKESALLTGLLEPTNEWYAIAKIAGIKLCQAYRRQYGSDFISLMPTNLYVRETILTSREATSFPDSCERCTTPSLQANRKSLHGAPAHLCANCFTSTIWPTHAFTSWHRIPTRSTSTLAPAKTSRSGT